MNRAMPAVIALVVTLVAFGSAFGVNTVVRYYVAPDGAVARPASGASGPDQRLAAANHTVTRPRVRAESEYLHDILKRNIFDAEFIKNYRPVTSSGGSESSSAQARTDLKVKLLGTVVAVPEQYSSALIIEEGDDHANGYGVGDHIHDARIVAIAQRLVTLERGDGRIEQLSMDDEGPRTTASAPRSDDSGSGVEQISETSFVVDRSLLDKHLADIEGLSRLGRALLHRGPDGNFDGYRLSAIRRGTIADQLGIKNGDVVHSVNGQPLDSVQGAMNAYQNMMNDSNFSFEVTRRGQKVTLDYQIR